MHVMVDIEKLGNQYDGEIIQISAVSFEFGKVSEPIEILENNDRFLNLYPESGNGYVDPETLHWWMGEENRAAFQVIESAPKLPIEQCLERLASFCRSYLGKRAMIWAKPPGYDLRALAYAYEVRGMPVPWSFRQEACLRTLGFLADTLPSEKFSVPDLSAKGLVLHNALHDCVAQAILAQSAQRALAINIREAT